MKFWPLIKGLLLYSQCMNLELLLDTAKYWSELFSPGIYLSIILLLYFIRSKCFWTKPIMCCRSIPFSTWQTAAQEEFLIPTTGKTTKRILQLLFQKNSFCTIVKINGKLLLLKEGLFEQGNAIHIAITRAEEVNMILELG